jgi:hypothetical protein
MIFENIVDITIVFIKIKKPFQSISYNT